MNTEAMQDRAAQEVFDQISALQTETERLRSENSDLISAHRSGQHANVQHQKECRMLKTQVDDLRSEVKRLQDSEFRASQKVLRLEQEIKRDSSKVGSIRAKFEPLSQELETVKLRAEADKQCADSTINALKSDIKASKDHAAKAQADLTMAHSTHDSEIESLKAELDALRTKSQHREDVLKEQLQAKEGAIDILKAERAKANPDDGVNVKDLQEQLAQSRRQLQNVEDENEFLVSDNERQAEEISNMQQTLEEERLNRLSSANDKVAELEDEIARMQAQKTTDLVSYADHQSALDELRVEHSIALTKLTKDHKDEVQTLRAAIMKAAEGMKKREQRIISSHQEESQNLKKQIKRLEAGAKTGATTSDEIPTGVKTTTDESNTIAQLRTQISTLNTRLNSTRKDLQQASAQAEEYRTQMSQSNAEYKAHATKQAKAYAETVKKMAEEYVQAEIAKVRASNDKHVEDQADNNPVHGQARQHHIVKRKSFPRIERPRLYLKDKDPAQPQAPEHREVVKRKSFPQIERMGRIPLTAPSAELRERLETQLKSMEDGIKEMHQRLQQTEKEREERER
ncbi:MAG: hypothetical protein Q9183_006449, partial [Haloplaca sp. 2 TL-2023]